GTVELRRFVDCDVALVRDRIFEENKWSVDRPIYQAHASSICGAVVKTVVLPAFKVDERAADRPVRAVVPGRRVGCGSAENAQRGPLRKSRAEIATINSVKARRPRKV